MKKYSYNSICILFLGILLIASVLPLKVFAQKGKDEGLIVVELYTSQGCIVCPPADATLYDLAKNKKLLPLSFHVDYWDYIGWKDTYAIPENLLRQWEYVRQLGTKTVYTPQMIVQGTFHFNGAKRSLVEEALKKAEELETVSISLRQKEDKSFVASFAMDSKKGSFKEANILLIGFDQPKGIKITRGNNRGKTMHYANVVRSIYKVGRWTGDSQDITIPLETFLKKKANFYAVLLQSPYNGRIIGAARVPFPSV